MLYWPGGRSLQWKLQSNCESKIPPTHLHPSFPGICPPGRLPRLRAQKGHCSVVPPSCPSTSFLAQRPFQGKCLWKATWAHRASQIPGAQVAVRKSTRPMCPLAHSDHRNKPGGFWRGRGGWQAFCRHPALCHRALTLAVARDQDGLMNTGC